MGYWTNYFPGLANLTKQMSLVFPLIATLILYSYPDKRKYLRVPGYWIGWLMSILFFAPFFVEPTERLDNLQSYCESSQIIQSRHS